MLLSSGMSTIFTSGLVNSEVVIFTWITRMCSSWPGYMAVIGVKGLLRRRSDFVPEQAIV